MATSRTVRARGSGKRPTAISADGRYIAFDSDATNLVAHDTNRHLDVFVYDRQTHTTRRVSVGPGGVQANNDSARVWFLGPRLLMYGSNATNLVPGDHHRAYALFVRNLRSGKTVRAAPAPIDPETLDWGQPSTYASRGRYIAFTNGLPGAGRRPRSVCSYTGRYATASPFRANQARGGDYILS